MAKWKDDNEYRVASDTARDGGNVFPLRSSHANDYGAGWDHAIFGGKREAPVGTEGGKDAALSFVRRNRVPPGPLDAPPQRPEGGLVAPPVYKPNRTPAFTRGLVHGMMWRRRNPRFY